MVLLLLLTASLGAAPSWPALSTPPAKAGGGENDAALIVAVEKYAQVPPVRGAAANARDWYAYLTKTEGVPASSVTVLLNEEVTVERLRRFLKQTAALARPGGRVWFVFVGHGAPSRDGSDGLLVGYDAQQDPESLFARSLPQSEVVAALSRRGGAKPVLVIDACFSGRTGEGEALIENLQPLLAVQHAPAPSQAVILSAGHADQFAGALPGAQRPAFSYLVLGGLRGWADANGDGLVSASEVAEYSREVLRTVVKDRSQTPELYGAPSDLVLSRAAKERGPDLEDFVSATLDRTASELSFSSTAGAISIPQVSVAASGGGLSNINLDAERAFERAMDAQESTTAPAAEKRTAWCALSAISDRNPYLAESQKACAAWKDYEDKRQKQQAALENDHRLLTGYLALHRKTNAQKLAAIDEYLKAYASAAADPRVSEIADLRSRYAPDSPRPPPVPQPRSRREEILAAREAERQREQAALVPSTGGAAPALGPSPAPLRTYSWIPLAAGGGMLALGGTLAGVAYANDLAIQQATQSGGGTASEMVHRASQGQVEQVAAIALLAAGGASCLAAAWMYGWETGRAPAISPAVGPGGVSIVISGELP